MPAATVDDVSPRDLERTASAIRFLVEHAEERPSLDDVAAHLHLSPFHAQRLFTRHAGTSPARLVRHLTATSARELLRQRRAVLDVTLETGLSSPGRLHDLTVTVDAMTPGEVGRDGAGLRIRVGSHATPFGPVAVGLTERGVCFLRFLEGREEPDQDAAVAAVTAEWPEARTVVDLGATAATVAAAFGPGGSGPVRVHVPGTNLQLKVWEALLRIPEGEVTTYGDLAAAVGSPAAHRAVASAVGRNPVAVLIPCHRVLRSTGALAGYRWGLDRKRALLATEAARRDEADGVPA